MLFFCCCRILGNRTLLFTEPPYGAGPGQGAGPLIALLMNLAMLRKEAIPRNRKGSRPHCWFRAKNGNAGGGKSHSFVRREGQVPQREGFPGMLAQGFFVGFKTQPRAIGQRDEAVDGLELLAAGEEDVAQLHEG